MAKPQGQWITVDSVVHDYISESGQSVNEYFRLWNICFRGMDELGINAFYEIRTEKVNINPNKTATLPAGCLNWTKIGVLTFDGQLTGLMYNNKITSYAAANPNRLTLTAGTIGSSIDSLYALSSPYFYNYWDGSAFGSLYGGGWYGGGFKMSGDLILLDNWSNVSALFVEGVFAPKAGEEYFVPMVFREALIEWMGWRDIKHLPRGRKGDIGTTRDRRHDYYNARRLAIAAWKPFNLAEAAYS